tara:strand:- start:56685 stop:57599 length:915 start_codon:yes stop_codon:yes gene_type:complete
MENNIKKALVTGGAGFIGSNLVDELLKKGFEVVVIDNESSDCHDQFYWNERAKNYKYDICEYEKIFPLFEGVDVVFHLAAEARIQPSIENPVLTTNVNVVGTCNVLQAARKNNVKRVIYSSTSSSYGNNKPPHKEDMQVDCMNPYCVSKVAGEDLCKMFYRLYGLETVILRYFNIYGERQPLKGQYATVIGKFLNQKKLGQPLTVIGDGLQRRDFTYVGDAVQANLLAAKSKSNIFGEILNIGTGMNYNILELVKILDGECVYLPPRPAECEETLADNKKANKKLGWEPKVNLEKWLKKELQNV